MAISHSHSNTSSSLCSTICNKSYNEHVRTYVSEATLTGESTHFVSSSFLVSALKTSSDNVLTQLERSYHSWVNQMINHETHSNHY